MLTFLRGDPIRSGRWFRTEDGREVHVYVFGGHVWHTHEEKTSCIRCSVLLHHVEDPSWEKCPDRVQEEDTAPWPLPVNSQLPIRRPPLATMPFPSTVARTLIQVDALPPVPLAYYKPEEG